MKRIFTLFLVLLNLSTYSQVNFFQDGATWGYHTIEYPDIWGGQYREWNEQFTITGDTIINSVTYKNIYINYKQYVYSSPGNLFYNYYDNYYRQVRYDSSFQKVFYYDILDSSEKIIYNFNISVGDTAPNLYHAPAVVDSIELISISGYQVRKYYYSNDLSFWPENYIIEGLGSNNGLIVLYGGAITFSGGPYTTLVCFQLDSIAYPTNTPCDIFNSVNTIHDFNKIVSVYPNPSEKSFHVKGPEVSEKYSMLIRDFLGRVVYSTEFNGEKDITDFSLSGIFFIEVFNNGNLIGKNKLILK